MTDDQTTIRILPTLTETVEATKTAKADFLNRLHHHTDDYTLKPAAINRWWPDRKGSDVG